MNVKILGTGSIYSKSNCASCLIDKKILIDIGPGTIKQLLKEDYDLGKINTILITHLHADHILDFPVFIINIAERKIKHKINIFSPEGTKEKFLDLLTLMYGNYFDEFIHRYINFVNIYDNQLIGINGYVIEVKEVIHTGIESYGFIINSQLGITGDASLCEGVKEIFEKSSTLICDCSFIEGNIYHMGINDIKTLLKLNSNKKILLTHFRDETRKKIQKLNLDSIVVCWDGYSFRLDN